MVISRKIQGPPPRVGPFPCAGFSKSTNATPDLSREDLVRDEVFREVRATLESLLYEHLERQALEDRAAARIRPGLAPLLSLAGAALTERRLRDLLRRAYRFPTSQGLLTFDQILPRSEADPLFETEARHLIWCQHRSPAGGAGQHALRRASCPLRSCITEF